ncbi:MAG: hypothetical protein AB7T74_02265 [Clostridia bacterium]
MKCERRSSWSAWVLVLLLLCMGLVSTRAEGQEMPSLPLSGSDSESSPSSMPSTEPKVIDLPPEFWQSWETFKTEFQAFSLSLETYLDQVEAYGISFEELPAFMTHLTESYKASESARMIEREVAEAKVVDAIMDGIHAEKERDTAVRSRDAWRTAALVSAGTAVLGWLLAIF